MLRNHKITFRNLVKHKGYSTINVLGLAIGLACVILITAWCLDELSYDRFHSKHERIFRIVSSVTSDSETFSQAVTSPPLAAALERDFPEVEKAVRLDMNDCIVRYGDRQFEEDGVLFADDNFFEIFDYGLSRGDLTTALREPYSVVLTESMARKYFGDENPIGKTMTLYLYDPDGRGAPYTVTGVTPDPPQNAHFTFNLIGSFSTYEAVAENADERWFENGYYTYVLLREGADAAALEARLPRFAERYLGDAMHEKDMLYSFALQPLTQIHLHSRLRYEIQANGSMSTVTIFATVGLFILLIAAINYMNLTTARSLGRAKEVGMKKVLGAQKSQLIRQFLVESTTVALLALALALLFVELLQPALRELTGKPFDRIVSGELFWFIAGATLLVGVLSGLYPAFFISRFKAATVLQGNYKSSASGLLLRKSLVVLQFAIAIVLLVGITVVKSQMNFIHSKDLGFDRDALLTLKVSGFAEVQQGIAPFKADLLSNRAIEGVSVSRGLIGGGLGGRYLETIDGSGKAISSNIYLHRTDTDFLDVYGIALIAGRPFSRADSQDVYLVNEAAVRAFGWGEPRQAPGKPLYTEGRQGRVIGVVEDFHFAPLHQRIEPVMIRLVRPNVFSNISVRLKTAELAETVKFIEATWRRHFPDALLQVSFLDERLAQHYRQQHRFGEIFSVFVVISLSIACLGLFGLAAFAAEQRTKEMGIRKVLGATVANLVGLLSKDFVRLVLIANVIAWPVAYIAMTKWLQNFAYRVAIAWWVFVLAGTIALVIAVLTVSTQAVRAALANPVESLRYE